ncbi:MAG: Rne/Rng family ribonuclease [Candidatus Binatia bacterium]
MSKTMLINMTHAEESRVGIVTNGVLTSFEIESASREHLKGNIYKGVVHRIHPALEAAFVDIGADRDAFLPLDEICFRNLPHLTRDNGNGGEGRRRLRIKEILKPGQEILVQIAKEEFASKPPTLSTFYSLPGRYLVLLPGSDDAGISRKIEGPDRSHLRELIDKLEPPDGFGIIVRTAAGFDQGSRELQRDLHYLLRLWETIRQAATNRRAPALVYREHDVVLRNIRDYFTPDVDEIYVDNEEVYQRAREFLHDVMPGKEGVLHHYKGDKPIFSHFNVETQIESIYKRRVPLKSGGSIVIDGTEALTAIDVNSGRSVRGGSQEETAYRTNIEAATEIARQLRLRDLGGLIVIDFIDMRSAQHAAEVEKTFREAMREDKARHECGRISHFGLLEVSRQRLRPAAAASSYTACPMCEGHGLVRTTESAALVALRKIHNRVAQGDAAALRVALPPEVAVYLLNQKRDDLAQLERRYATRIQVVLKEGLMPHQLELEVRSRLEVGQGKLPARVGGVAPEQATAAPTETAEAPAVAEPPTAGASLTPEGDTPPAAAKRRRRRRGRRRGRGRQGAPAAGETLTADEIAPPTARDAEALERSAERPEPSAGVEEEVAGSMTPPPAEASRLAVSTVDAVETREDASAPEATDFPAEAASVEAAATPEPGAASGAPAVPAEVAADAASVSDTQEQPATPKPRGRRSRGGASRRGGRGGRSRTKASPEAAAETAGETVGPGETMATGAKGRGPRTRKPTARTAARSRPTARRRTPTKAAPSDAPTE